ncbi:N-acetylglucosamine kinase [Sediminibacillus halophilus]|uniref:BadF-type ATPase n=1 Tax=Sediminibacillus halophilus TaxID=482461 RepID=A0A1G9RR91_9BACI|nr:BadF/BadG/BcrA/BcrD ATPase family protein [Sediminibacillus halophilus]SDM25487.1 BadF-type ATPase [Sediminibacillus halophilus]
MPFVIGMDGGGTKTTCLIKEVGGELQKNGRLVEQFQGPGTNPHVVGFETAAARIGELIRYGLEAGSLKTEEVSAVCCGLAGVGRKSEEQRMQQLISDELDSLKMSEYCELDVCSDSYIALRGALEPGTGEGILVISGTGSNALALTNSGKLTKSGGWGHVLGDEGSGYYIGMKALNYITRAYDGRDKATMLTSLILKRLQLEKTEDLIAYIYGERPEKREIASLARQVIEAAEHRDEAAENILRQAGEELLTHVESLFRKNPQFTKQTVVTAAGSIFTYSTLVRETFINGLRQRNLGIYRKAYQSPAFGAAIVAEELAHPSKQ